MDEATRPATREPPERSRWRAATMARAQDGDRNSYRALLEDLTPALRRYFARHLRDPAEVEDLVQETLLSIHRGRHTYDPQRPLEPWVFAIARNVKSDFLRRALKRQSWEILLEDHPEQPAEEAMPSAMLVEALEALPESQRRAFRHLKIEGRTVHEAAEIEGTSEGNLRVRAHRAYRTLKALLSK